MRNEFRNEFTSDGMNDSTSDHDSRWGFLEGDSDAMAVVNRRMEVVFLNAAARPLVPPRWAGLRCWEVFPVKDSSCVYGCAAIRAVREPDGILYCEETVYPAESEPLRLGVAVVPAEDSGCAVLVLRAIPTGVGEDGFRTDLLAKAHRLRSRCEALAG